MVYGAALEKRSPVIPERGFESHPLRQYMERCWSGLSGAPGERVSGFPTVGSNPTLSANYLEIPFPFIPLPQGRGNFYGQTRSGSDNGTNGVALLSTPAKGDKKGGDSPPLTSATS